MVLNIYSPQWDPHDSYGILARKIAERAGEWVNRIGLDDKDGVKIIPAAGGILLGYPTTLDRHSVLLSLGRRIIVTMFESTILPAEWPEKLNQFDSVVVPAQFLAGIFRAQGVTVPIHVVPLGIDDVYLQVQRQARQDRPYTFLAIADRGRRKGWDLAWHAFRSAFGNSRDHRLILKCRDGGLPNITSADENVEILRADLDVNAMAALYARCDCMVFPTRGEGFGLPPREFAATGGVVLATNWGGTADQIDQWGFQIPYRMTPAWVHDQFEGQCGEWAEPDVNALARQMKTVATWDALLARTARIKAKGLRRLYDWNAFADRVLEIYHGD